MAKAAAPTEGRRANRRGAARLAAVQALYQMDLAATPLNEALAQFETHWIGRKVEGDEYLPAEAAHFRDIVRGVVALGCVIQGETFHFDIVSMQSARALIDFSVENRLPCGNGILTVDTEPQAWARARISEQDKGGDAARAALALIALKRQSAQK